MKYATKKTVNELEELFQFVPPKKLNKRLSHLFLEFLQNTPTAQLPKNLRKQSEDLQFLLRFLEKAHKYKRL